MNNKSRDILTREEISITYLIGECSRFSATFPQSSSQTLLTPTITT